MPCEEKTVWIMEIERFAIHDGPGIRTTVFMQGCPLHCPWCSNPESQRIGSQLMYQERKCSRCRTCMKNCPAGAIRLVDGRMSFQREQCLHCRTCERSCPNQAIHLAGEEVPVSRVMETVARDRIYYEESGGGVTFSGGEPFVQFEALRGMAEACHREYHVAVETTGDTRWERMEACIPYLDLFLYDVKHYDPERVRAVTGGNGGRIQENLQRLSALIPERIIARVPVIPGFNSDRETIERIFRMVRELGLKKIDLLPYHTLGIDKYAQLDREYLVKERTMMKRESLLPLEKIGRDLGLEVWIGGV